MKTKKVKLTEADLRDIIKNCVNEALANNNGALADNNIKNPWSLVARYIEELSTYLGQAETRAQMEAEGETLNQQYDGVASRIRMYASTLLNVLDTYIMNNNNDNGDFDPL